MSSHSCACMQYCMTCSMWTVSALVYHGSSPRGKAPRVLLHRSGDHALAERIVLVSRLLRCDITSCESCWLCIPCTLVQSIKCSKAIRSTMLWRTLELAPALISWCAWLRDLLATTCHQPCGSTTFRAPLTCHVLGYVSCTCSRLAQCSVCARWAWCRLASESWLCQTRVASTWTMANALSSAVAICRST
jgi:hypothetical protein